jgi:signal transduction histidine kinase
MNDLTEDLLLFSVLEQDIETEDVNIKDILNQSSKDLELIAEKSGIKFEKSFGRSESTIRANPVLLQRAIMNILENAIKYSEGSKIEVSLVKKNKNLNIIIKDNGKGIPREHIDQIFNRFYRIDKSRSRETGGSGLGLSITKNIVEKFEGNIKVESKENEGATFVMQFPVIGK